MSQYYTNDIIRKLDATKVGESVTVHPGLNDVTPLIAYAIESGDFRCDKDNNTMYIVITRVRASKPRELTEEQKLEQECREADCRDDELMERLPIMANSELATVLRDATSVRLLKEARNEALARILEKLP